MGGLSPLPWILLLGMALLAPARSLAQGGLGDWLGTSGASRLLSHQLLLPAPPSPAGGSVLEFDVGWSSSEAPEEGRILDQFNGTLSDLSGRNTLPLFSWTASSLDLFPRLPGFLSPPQGIPEPASIPAKPPIELLLLDTTLSFHLAVAIPAELMGRPVRLNLSFYDNLDDTPSEGWISGARLVPEPPPLAAAILCTAVLLFRRRRTPTPPSGSAPRPGGRAG